MTATVEITGGHHDVPGLKSRHSFSFTPRSRQHPPRGPLLVNNDDQMETGFRADPHPCPRNRDLVLWALHITWICRNSGVIYPGLGLHVGRHRNLAFGNERDSVLLSRHFV